MRDAVVAVTNVNMETDGSKQKRGRIICLILCLVGDSNLFKEIIANQIEPLTEQQLMGICGLQQSTQEAEEALSQGLDALNQSLSDVIVSDSLSSPPNMANYMGQMAMAMSKLSTLEGFVRQVL
ncbi:DOG1 domain-containing protein [Heracleum sosnowskyi]|uniref:DOG1 domain-containing protein n=1 Tax=Heracleum sosnowskyi TaxID=360622 RepID=A0AAD8N9V8_9APIA|nr:DOG1 domain-containing protein [Heracleum sosnowskyi]